MITIENTQECFVQLWLRLERTRRLLHGQCKRYCIRRVLKTWFGFEANDDFIWEVCSRCEQAGYDELPLPSLYPRKHRELLRAIVAVKLGISSCRVKLKALDKAYSIAFPKSTPINVEKKKPHPLARHCRFASRRTPSPRGEGEVSKADVTVATVATVKKMKN